MTIRGIALTSILLLTLSPTNSIEDGYLRYVKDGCFIRGEALSCVKFKALKLAKKTIFDGYTNETIKANHMISFVPLEGEFEMKDDEIAISQPRGFFSEWAELTKYGVKMVKDFIKAKGLRVNLPKGSRTIEEDDEESVEEGRGRKKKLAVIVPMLTLLAALKTKLLLIPVLLAVLLIKKLLLLAALLVPSLLHTIKICKVHHGMHHSFFGSADASDFSTGYSNSYSLAGSGAGYGKDWASNRAYSMPKLRPSPSPSYITAPGAVAS